MTAGGDKYTWLRNYWDGDIIVPVAREDIEITLFASAQSTQAHTLQTGVTWPEIVDFCRGEAKVPRHRSNKLAAPALIAGRCEGTRANANVRFLSLICADFDLGPDDVRYRTFDDMVQYLAAEDLSFVAYTTTANTAGHNRYRIIMPLARNVSPTVWPAIWQAANAKFQNTFDPATKDPARLSFLPAHWIGNPYHDGRKGTVKLASPYNDFAAYDEGRPILSDDEIDGIEASQAAQALRQVSATRTHQRAGAQPHGAAQANPAASRANPSTLRPLLTGDVSPIAARWLTSLAGPLVTKFMRDTLPNIEGSRTHRFLCMAALRARDQEITINTDILHDLAANWLIQNGRPSPRDLLRQARNAIDFVATQPQY